MLQSARDGAPVDSSTEFGTVTIRISAQDVYLQGEQDTY